MILATITKAKNEQIHCPFQTTCENHKGQHRKVGLHTLETLWQFTHCLPVLLWDDYPTVNILKVWEYDNDNETEPLHRNFVVIKREDAEKVVPFFRNTNIWKSIRTQNTYSVPLQLAWNASTLKEKRKIKISGLKCYQFPSLPQVLLHTVSKLSERRYHTVFLSSKKDGFGFFK